AKSRAADWSSILSSQPRGKRWYLYRWAGQGRIDMPRASWRGYLRLSLVSCPIYLSPATARTKPIRLHQVWRATSAENGGDLEDQVGGEDVLERPTPRFTSDDVEDQAERARPATRITLRPRDP